MASRSAVSSRSDSSPPLGRGRVVGIVAAALGVLVVFVAGVIVGGHPQATGLTNLSGPLRTVFLGDSGEELSRQVLDVLEDEYYVAIDSEELERSSVQAIVDALEDPYTDYLDPDELQAQRDRNDGAYVGVGMQVAERGSSIVVTALFEDGPADRARVRPGDRITSVGGDSTVGKDLAAVVGSIRGPEGTTVAVGLRTGTAPERVLTLERERIEVPPVTARIEHVDGTKVGYLRLAQFTRGASDALRDAIRRQREKGAEAFVLDLRGDPGGLVDEAVGVAGVFLPRGAEVVVTEGLHSPREVYRTDTAPAAEDLPLTVLVDRGSASASEIVAGALRDGDRARLVGERTFGKALVQSTVLLRDGGALKLTTARYLTPSGFDLAARGLSPDVRVVDDPATPLNEVLERGLALAAAG